MADKEQLAQLRNGVKTWNGWREKNPRIKIDLSDAALSGADLSDADLKEADLRRADLRGADLSGAILTLANLHEANLSVKDLSGANLSIKDLSGTYLHPRHISEVNFHLTNLTGASLLGTDLRGADLSGAVLISTNFHVSSLSETIFSQAIAGETFFNDVDLSEARGLEELRHAFPSSIGINTVYNSKGNIPEVFLRGCGVPEDMIVYARSLRGKAIEFYSCFISYSSQDDSFAKRLHADLQSKGVRVWFAPEDVKGGEKLYEQINRAIHFQDKLLVVLSENSLQSEWVMTELRRAHKEEREEKRRKIFPIRLVDFDTIKRWECFDADSGKDLAVEVREYFIPDFSNWSDQDSYSKAFEGLLRDLKAGDGKVA